MLCLVWVGVQIYMRYVVQRATSELMEIVTHSAAQSMTQARKILENQKRRVDQEARAKAEQDAALQRARLLEQQRMQRKAAAWNVYFKPSARCKEDPINAECANAHIRAKKKFEDTYSDPA